MLLTYILTLTLLNPTWPLSQTVLLSTESAEQLKLAQSYYDDIEYEECLRMLDLAEKNGNLSSEENVLLYALRGKTHAILDNNDAAYDAFWSLLQYSPDYLLDPNESPKILAVFNNVKKQVEKLMLQRAIKILPQATAPFQVGQRIYSIVKLGGNAKSVLSLAFYFRYQGETVFNPLRVEQIAPDAWQGFFPATQMQNPGNYFIEYYVELYGQAQAPFKTLGSSIAPQTMQILVQAPTPQPVQTPPQVQQSPTRSPFYTQSWFWWTNAGLAATLTTLYLINNQNQAPNAPLGEIPMD